MKKTLIVLFLSLAFYNATQTDDQKILNAIDINGLLTDTNSDGTATYNLDKIVKDYLDQGYQIKLHAIKTSSFDSAMVLADAYIKKDTASNAYTVYSIYNTSSDSLKSTLSPANAENNKTAIFQSISVTSSVAKENKFKYTGYINENGTESNLYLKVRQKNNGLLPDGGISRWYNTNQDNVPLGLFGFTGDFSSPNELYLTVYVTTS